MKPTLETVKSELKLQNQVLGKFGKLPQDAEGRKKELKMMRETVINVEDKKWRSQLRLCFLR